MIKQSKYLPKQVNGEVINSVMMAMDERLEDSEKIADYLYGLSIATAKETELMSIGRILGYPRPLVPEGFEQENVFLFTGSLQRDIDIGFSEVGGSVGGRFVSSGASESNYISLSLYRKFLDKVAYIKRYGITLYAVDAIAKSISNRYTISYDEFGDISLTFLENIGYKNMWILTSLFSRFCTVPQVNVYTQSEEDEE